MSLPLSLVKLHMDHVWRRDVLNIGVIESSANNFSNTKHNLHREMRDSTVVKYIRAAIGDFQKTDIDNLLLTSRRRSIILLFHDSEDSTVTYTKVSSPFEDLSDIGSLGVDRLSMMPEDPYAYVEATMQEPPSPEFVPEPVYPEFMPSEDEVFPAKEQPLPAAISPTADLPGYIADSDPKEDEEDPEKDPIDYLADGKDDDDDDDKSSNDDKDDDDVEKDADEEEEHLAPADSVPSPAYRTTARMSIRPQTHVPFPSEAEVDRLLAISPPPPSPLTSYSSPLLQIPSPPLPVSSPLPISPPPLPTSPTHPLGYRAAMIRLRASHHLLLIHYH
ncbi:hypothetical protein Tco_0456361 [Tanacetum coccineum]